MKKILSTILLSATVTFSNAQDKAVPAASYVIIANNKIITEAQLQEYGEKGYIRSMNTGVSEAQWEKIKKKFGARAGEDKAFIVTIDLMTEKEAAAARKAAPPVKTDNTAVEDGTSVQQPAPDFSVTLTDGSSVQLSSLKGKVVLLNFWATWCGPCLMEFHEIPSQILQPLKDKDFVFLPVSIGEKQETVTKKMEQLAKKNIIFPAGFDKDLDIWKQYATDQSIPKNYLIDKNGNIRYILTGYTKNNLKILKKEIDKLLAE